MQKEQVEKMAIVLSRGLDDERCSVAWVIANGSLATGLDVTMFLVSNGADVARKGAAEHVRMNPLDPPLKELMQSFIDAGGKIWVCPPCAAVRSYKKEDLIDEAELKGSAALADMIQNGAATLCF